MNPHFIRLLNDRVSDVERRWFSKHLGEEKWLHYGVLYDETIEKNGTTSREPLN
jgi:hypothetical protein